MTGDCSRPSDSRRLRLQSPGGAASDPSAATSRPHLGCISPAARGRFGAAAPLAALLAGGGVAAGRHPRAKEHQPQLTRVCAGAAVDLEGREKKVRRRFSTHTRKRIKG